MTIPSCTPSGFDDTLQQTGVGKVIDFNGWGQHDEGRHSEAVDLETAAQSACHSLGVSYRATPADGNFHSLDVEDKPARNGAGRIRIFPDGEGGQVWNHVTGETLLFWARSEKLLSPAEQSERRQRAKEEQAKSEALLAEKRAAAAKLAVDVLMAAQDPRKNPYLERKQVPATETLREMALSQLVGHIGYHPQIKGEAITGERILLVPVGNGTEVTTIEMIDASGRKPALKDGQKKGCFWSTCHLPTGDGAGLTFGIGEGVATVLTCSQATGLIGVAALSCGNLLAVSRYFRDRYPASEIVILSDLGNGEKDAAEAAKAAGGALAVPVFPASRGPKDTDFNDLARVAGTETVRQQLQAMVQHVEQPQKITLFESATEFLLQDVRIEYLIHRLLEVSNLISLTGPSGQYKSFIAVCIACAISTGRDWNGRKVKQGHVLYLAGEGREGVKRRVTAYAIANKLTPADLSGFHLSKHTLMMDGSNIDQIVTEASNLGVVLLIVDTLARHMVGHENDTQEMGAFVNCVDQLKGTLGAAALVVHHTGHDQTRGRGNSAYKAALDVEIMCDRGVLTFTKMKDAEPPAPIEFKLNQVEIGTDPETGEPITSAVVEYGERSAANRNGLLTRMEQIAVNALIEAAVKSQTPSEKPGALVGDWRATFYEKRKADLRKEHSREEDANAAADVPKKTLESSFKRAQEGLITKKIIGEEGHLRVLLLPEHRDEVVTRLTMPPMDAGCITDASGSMHPAADSGCMDAPPLRGASDASRAGSPGEANMPEWGRPQL